MKDFYVYILQCNDDSYYVGHTDDISRRINQHSLGKESGYVSTRLPIELAFLQACASRAEAIIAERKLKGWSHKKKKALIEGGFNKVQQCWKQNKNKKIN